MEEFSFLTGCVMAKVTFFGLYIYKSINIKINRQIDHKQTKSLGAFKVVRFLSFFRQNCADM